MKDEQTNKADTLGDKDAKPSKTTDKVPEQTDKPLSDYDKALALVKRREEVTKVELEVLAKKEKLAANALLGGDSGGHVETAPAKEETDKEYRQRIEKELAEGKHDRRQEAGD